jgi:hypothetical protein
MERRKKNLKERWQKGEISNIGKESPSPRRERKRERWPKREKQMVKGRER